MIASRDLILPPRVDYLYVEQEVQADDTPAVDAVLKADTVRWKLLEEEKTLTEAIDNGDEDSKKFTRLQEVLDELNARIVDWIRFPTPPIVPLGPVDVENWMESWRINRAEVDRLAREHRSQSAEPLVAASDTAGASWWARVRRTLTWRR